SSAGRGHGRDGGDRRRRRRACGCRGARRQPSPPADRRSDQCHRGGALLMPHDLLLGYAGAAFEDAGNLGAVVAELEVFSAALTASDELRSVLTDAMVPEAARRAVAADLLKERADAVTASTVDFALRVVRPGELAAAIADLAAAATQARDGST